MTFNTRTTYTQKPVRLAIRLWGAADQCTMLQVPLSIPWHREHWNIQLKAHLKPQYQIIQYTNMDTPTIGIYVSQKEYISVSKNVATMCGMYMINGVHGPEPMSSGGNTSSNPQVSALIPRPAFNGMERMCKRHGSNQNSHPPVLVRKPVCNQLIHYHISSRGVFGINRFKLRKKCCRRNRMFFCNGL